MRGELLGEFLDGVDQHLDLGLVARRRDDVVELRRQRRQRGLALRAVTTLGVGERRARRSDLRGAQALRPLQLIDEPLIPDPWDIPLDAFASPDGLVEFA